MKAVQSHPDRNNARPEPAIDAKSTKISGAGSDKLHMERRAEPRLPWNAPIRITVLSSPPRHYDAVLVNVSGRGARLRLEQPLDCDLPVRIDLNNALLLGEVCYCATDGDGFGVGILLEHSLMNLAEVVRMRDRILTGSGELAPAAPRRA